MPVDRPQSRSAGFVLAAILLLCLIARGSYVVYLTHAKPEISIEGDTHSYVRPARAIVEDGRFNRMPGLDEAEYLRTPGYPALVATVYWLIGESAMALLLVQVVLSALTVMVVYLFASRIWSTTIGLVAAAVTVLEPLQNYTTGTIVTECLDALLLILVCAVGYAVFSAPKPRLGWLVVLGFALATATMVGPVTYYLPCLVALLLLGRALRGAMSWAALVKMLAAFLVPFIVIVGGWQLRNYERAGSWRVSGIEGKNVYFFRAAGVVAEQEGISLDAAQERLLRRVPEPDTVSQGAYYDRMHDEGVEILLNDPVTALRLTGEGLLNELTSVRYKAFEYFGFAPATGAVAFVAFVLLVGVYVVVGYGFVRAIRERRALLAHVFIAGVAIYVLLASAGPEALDARGERFRAPIMPILILYAARGSVELFRRLREEQEIAPVEVDSRIAGRQESDEQVCEWR